MPLSPPAPTRSPAPDTATAADGPALRSRFAAFGIVGALALALPLVEVLRYQHDELAELAQQRAMLDPVGRTLALQRGLIGHREVAARVLDGEQALEAERRLRQADVDQGIEAVAEALHAGPWEAARREAGSLREDWSALLGRVVARSVAPPASNEAHRLLVEQALQIIDVVGDGIPAAVSAAGPEAVPQQAPGWPQHARLAVRLARHDGAAAQAELHVLQAAALRAAATLDHRIGQARTHRAVLLGGCAALLLAALGCGWRLWRALRPPRPAVRRSPIDAPDADDAWATLQTTAHQHGATDLIERLRRGEEHPAAEPVEQAPRR